MAAYSRPIARNACTQTKSSPRGRMPSTQPEDNYPPRKSALMYAQAAAPAGDGLAAAFTVTWDWGSGYEATYTITNNTSTAVSGWVVAFDLPAGQQMGNYWNALEAASGSHYTFTNRDYNGQLAPNGRTASFGFIVIYSGSLV